MLFNEHHLSRWSPEFHLIVGYFFVLQDLGLMETILLICWGIFAYDYFLALSAAFQTLHRDAHESGKSRQL